MIARPIVAVTLVDRIVLELAGRGCTGGWRMGRQRQDGRGMLGVVVAVLLPAVADEHEVSRPAGRWGRGNRKAESELVARVHDDVAVVDAGNELAHVAEACIEADEVAPALTSRRHRRVRGSLRRMI